ncbi:hypothetical protein IQ230_24690 [Gloeocapsopsis crepidinum LEGE 06123]|uniref:Uncharacterized protein n=1 Tax=Gloeocapsopsis crepidinum LEGE 06123 TaxID=588587 RepID=A0ABR9UYU7_9CHRO|nr:hypothetical protein [Gloeocapsopsis crepidinum]MBE9193477.1 hypothetical protein [Gloeocapsopsis crepidinum LEGE 06123]
MGWKLYLERNGFDWIGSFDLMHFYFEGSGCKDMRHLSTLAFQQLYNCNNRSDQLAEDGVFGQATQRALMQTLVSGFGIAEAIHLSRQSPFLALAALRSHHCDLEMKGGCPYAANRTEETWDEYCL